MSPVKRKPGRPAGSKNKKVKRSAMFTIDDVQRMIEERLGLVGKQAAKPETLVAEIAPESALAVPTRKKQVERNLRVFRYRGEPFMCINHEDLTLVCTVDKDSNKPVPKLEVPKENASSAVKILTKIIKAEKALGDLGGKPAEENNV